jgi:hypothetical protein
MLGAPLGQAGDGDDGGNATRAGGSPDPPCGHGLGRAELLNAYSAHSSGFASFRALVTPQLVLQIATHSNTNFPHSGVTCGKLLYV